MSTFKLSPDDPRLTAYALGELQGEERAAVETALRDDPVAQAAVDEIRATVARLEFALASEPLEPAAPEPRTEVYKPKGKVLRFPQVYYLVGGLAAACFAVFVALRPQPQPAASKHYVPVALAPAPAPQNVAAPAMADATNAQAMAP